MEFDNFSLMQIQEYLRDNGKKGKMTISILSKLYPYFTAVFNTELGKQLLAEDIGRMDELMVKVYREEANPQELAEFRYLRDKRLPSLMNMINTFTQQVEEVKKGIHKS